MKMIAYALAGLALASTAACANPMHSSWAYTPLQDGKSAAFEPAPKKTDYREFKTVDELAAAEDELSEQGLVMIGYVNMISPQPEFVGRGGAKKWGDTVGASHVLNTVKRGHWLATYWAKPKHMPLGAFYTGDLPKGASEALQGVFEQGSAVIVDFVAEGSPADQAGIEPGDLLVEVNEEPILSPEYMSARLRELAGQTVILTVWPMLEGGPHYVEVALNR